MWDTVQQHRATGSSLGHDLPCLRCGHAAHRFLACDSSCGCVPAEMPGAVPLAV